MAVSPAEQCDGDGDGGFTEETHTVIDPLTVQQSFHQVIEKYLQADSQTDIKRRLDGLFTDWTAGRLNSDIQLALRDLAGCLEREDVAGSEASFTVLTADWSSLIGPSNILNIKKIIYAVKLALNTDTEEEAVTKPL